MHALPGRPDWPDISGSGSGPASSRQLLNPHRRVIMAAAAARAHARYEKAKQSKRGDWRVATDETGGH